MERLLPFVAAAVLLAPAAPAAAAERGFTLTSFDRIRVEGPFAVTMTSGRGPAARATGSPAALDTLRVRVEGRTLLIQRDTTAWGGFPGQDRGRVTIAVAGPGVVAATLAGSGTLEIDRMSGQRVDLTVAGSGRIGLGRVEADRLGASVSGSGGLAITGRALLAQVNVSGSGRIEAAGLTANDATVTATGSGDIALGARRTARVQVTGSGNVVIGGTPACTVRRIGSGTVSCGGKG